MKGKTSWQQKLEEERSSDHSWTAWSADQLMNAIIAVCGVAPPEHFEKSIAWAGRHLMGEEQTAYHPQYVSWDEDTLTMTIFGLEALDLEYKINEKRHFAIPVVVLRLGKMDFDFETVEVIPIQNSVESFISLVNSEQTFSKNPNHDLIEKAKIDVEAAMDLFPSVTKALIHAFYTHSQFLDPCFAAAKAHSLLNMIDRTFELMDDIEIDPDKMILPESVFIHGYQPRVKRLNEALRELSEKTQ